MARGHRITIRDTTDTLLRKLETAKRDENGIATISVDGKMVGFKQHRGDGWRSVHSIVPETTVVDSNAVVVRGSIPSSVSRVLRGSYAYWHDQYDH